MSVSKNLQFSVVMLGALLVICGCGKVVQQVTEDEEDVPVFVLNVMVDNVKVIDDTQKTNKKNSIKKAGASALLEAVPVTRNVFKSNQPTYINLKGYKKNKVKNLAWSKAIVDVSRKEKVLPTTKKVSPNRKKEYVTVFKSTAYDHKKIKVKSAKKSQFSARFNDKQAHWTFTTTKVAKTYDYYVVSAHTGKDTYRIKVIDQKEVSGNKLINIGPVTYLDTFHALVFSEAFRTTSFTHSMFTTIPTLFTPKFFKSLDYVFPSLKEKGLYQKGPLIRINAPIIEECVFILELLTIDREEAQIYVKDSTKKVFTDRQKQILLDAINVYAKTKA